MGSTRVKLGKRFAGVIHSGFHALEPRPPVWCPARNRGSCCAIGVDGIADSSTPLLTLAGEGK